MVFSSKVTLGLGSVVLLGGLALALLGTRPPPEPKFKGRLIDLLPTAADLPGWTVEHLPIADTPEMQARVMEVLNYADAQYAVYRKNGIRISIYIAYWQPAAVPAREVARHTPDVCWVHSGWNRVTRDKISERKVGPKLVAAQGEYRVFTINGTNEYVAFWHLIGGVAFSYNTGTRAPWYAALVDAFRWGLEQKPEQFFVRISSDKPIEDFWDTAVVEHLLRVVPGAAK